MENATKALIIAAAVLIAIVLISLGIKILGTASDPASQAETVSTQMNQATHNAVSSVSDALSGI